MRQIVPLISALSSGTGKYSDVALSLASATPVPIHIIVSTQTRRHRLQDRGRDLAADIGFTTTMQPEAVVGLVEFSRP